MKYHIEDDNVDVNVLNKNHSDNNKTNDRDNSGTNNSKSNSSSTCYCRDQNKWQLNVNKKIRNIIYRAKGENSFSIKYYIG